MPRRTHNLRLPPRRMQAARSRKYEGLQHFHDGCIRTGLFPKKNSTFVPDSDTVIVKPL